MKIQFFSERNTLFINDNVLEKQKFTFPQIALLLLWCRDPNVWWIFLASARQERFATIPELMLESRWNLWPDTNFEWVSLNKKAWNHAKRSNPGFKLFVNTGKYHILNNIFSVHIFNYFDSRIYINERSFGCCANSSPLRDRFGILIIVNNGRLVWKSCWPNLIILAIVQLCF